MRKMGFEMNFSKTSLRELSIDHADVAWEDARADMVWRTICSRVKFRAGSMLWHTVAGPGFTAGFVHQSAAKRLVTLTYLKRVDEAKCINTARHK